MKTKPGQEPLVRRCDNCKFQDENDNRLCWAQTHPINGVEKCGGKPHYIESAKLKQFQDRGCFCFSIKEMNLPLRAGR